MGIGSPFDPMLAVPGKDRAYETLSGAQIGLLYRRAIARNAHQPDGNGVEVAATSAKSSCWADADGSVREQRLATALWTDYVSVQMEAL